MSKERESDPRKVQRLVKSINSTISDCDTLIADVDAALSFATSVKEKLESMKNFIMDHSWYTVKQSAAIKNMTAGVDKWMEAMEANDHSDVHPGDLG